MTVYEFAKKCMNDVEFNKGGIVKNERKYLDAIGFEYTVKDGQVAHVGDDLKIFYAAMTDLLILQKKYAKALPAERESVKDTKHYILKNGYTIAHGDYYDGYNTIKRWNIYTPQGTLYMSCGTYNEAYDRARHLVAKEAN